jgi:hypothetical protein
MINPNQLWNQYYSQATARAAQYGYKNTDQINAFAHTYVSAFLAKDYGATTAYVAGTGKEFLNH